MSILSGVLAKVGLAERRKDGRFAARGLEVIYWTGAGQKRAKVKDISATGFYVFTEDRWSLGTPVQLTLQKRGLLEKDSQTQVRLRAWCVRVGDDGVGMTFVEEPAEAVKWSKYMVIAAELFPDSHPVSLFRAAKAMSFLWHTCPSAEFQILQLITRLGRERAERAIEIAIHAEEMLASRGLRSSSGIAPNLVLRILEEGSKTYEESMRQCWAGLFASSYLEEMQDSTLRFVTLLSKLDPDHIAIIAAAYTKAMRAGWRPRCVFSSTLYCSADEIRKIAGIRNLVAIGNNLDHLYHLGLLEKTNKPLGCAQLDQVNITPTSLGLSLYFECSGHTELSEVLNSSALEMAS
jgi:PilZ domain